MLKQELLLLIEKKRAEMIKVANTNGFASPAAIRYSQELDELLNNYDQKYIEKK